MDILERALGIAEKVTVGEAKCGTSLTNERFLQKYEKVSNYLRFYAWRFRDQEEAFQNMSCWSFWFFLDWSQRGKKTAPTGLAKYSYWAHLGGRVFGAVGERYGGANHLEGRDFYWAQQKGKAVREPLLFENDGDSFSDRFFCSDEDAAFRVDFEEWLNNLRPPCCKEYFLLRAQGYSVVEIASLRGVCAQTVSKFSNYAVDSFCEHFDVPQEKRDYLKNHCAHQRPVESPETVPKDLPYEKYIERRRRHYPQSQRDSSVSDCLPSSHRS
jgi:hypothetical protein